MEMYEVESSFIRAIGYDPIERTLGIALSNEKGIYEYEDVPITRYAGFWNADSKGAYYNRFIKGKYDHSGPFIDDDDDDVQTHLDGTVNFSATQMRALAANILDEAIDLIKSWV